MEYIIKEEAAEDMRWDWDLPEQVGLFCQTVTFIYESTQMSDILVFITVGEIVQGTF